METYRIESILGGESASGFLRKKNQFYYSSGIDPGLSAMGTYNAYGATGALCPVGIYNIDNSTIAQASMWMETTPKDQFVYIYGGAGSLYTLGPSLGSSNLTALGDGGCLTSSTGNGMAYYDNYIYLAKNTDIARYGPLNGAPVFDGSYWDTTLAKSALVDTQYPKEYYTGIEYPNHFLHRHSDNRLYIADVVGNKGMIHYIKTTYGAAEGDTNDGSTEQALDLPYGLYPTCMESYGNDLAIAIWEGTYATVYGQHKKAKIAFWDTTSDSYNKLVYVDYPDEYITAMKSVNGVLYVLSGRPGGIGTRVMRFIGGYSFEEVYCNEIHGGPPFPGSVFTIGDRLIFGRGEHGSTNNSGLLSMGLNNGIGKGGFFSVAQEPIFGSSSTITAATSVRYAAGKSGTAEVSDDLYLMGSTELTPGVGHCALVRTTDEETETSLYPYNTPNTSNFYSGEIVVGRPFQVTEVRIPAQISSDTNIVTVNLSTDTGSFTSIGTIDYQKDNKRFHKFVVGNTFGEHSFALKLAWSYQTVSGFNYYPAIVLMPIEIDFEYLA